MRDLVKRMERALGEENKVTLETLNTFGTVLKDNGQYEEAIKIFERCLVGQMKVLGEDHKDTLDMLNKMGAAYYGLMNYEKALKYFERALNGGEKTMGKNHLETLTTVINIANVYTMGMRNYGNAEELYEAQLGKDHQRTKMCAMNFRICLERNSNSERLTALISSYPWLTNE
ncbi:hypothetical protein TrLO_g2658 [Triparma laevis f. longispina]|uniref:Kinesin light chain n=1 Tax=Triparma laevis f. longispina TaxID=1714387 RepID=A0A9W7AP20_9STRA|nr:hypothetical protein TrLO_g2658 [Triparma laevis f. longispina]